jgi:NAD(P)-dependent dehydrogenase (short-subunit alcohol dehydrogenase family)
VLQDKVVIITGAGSGVGRGLAAGFCRDGAHVIGFGRTRTDLDETAERHGRGRMRAVVGDVASADDVERLFAEVEAEHGGVDVLVNNAAVYPRVSFLESSMEDFERDLKINVMGVARTCRRALPGMLARGHGRVINVGSFAFKAPIPRSALYSASKGAVDALTRAIAADVSHPDVLVNQLMPGIYRTRMTPDQGDDPMNAYPHARALALLPRGGAHGATFLLGDRFDDQPRGVRDRIANKVRHILGR